MNACGVGMISAGLFGALWVAISPAQAQMPLSVEGHYEVYAAGLDIATVQTDYEIGPRAYQMRTSYHTVGVVSLFANGVNTSTISGTWRGETALPRELIVEGSWKGDPRQADIDFSGDTPVVRRLVPSDARERTPVPEAVKAGSIDALSAFAELIHFATDTGRCDLTVRTYDGHRVLRFDTQTAGHDALSPYRNAQFTGSALRCDFTATPIAGMKDGDEADARPFRGSIWLAPLTPGAGPFPVRLAFETRWFGDAIMGLIKTVPLPDVMVAGTH